MGWGGVEVILACPKITSDFFPIVTAPREHWTPSVTGITVARGRST